MPQTHYLEHLLPMVWKKNESGQKGYAVSIVDCIFHPIREWTYNHVFNSNWAIYCSLGAKTNIRYEDSFFQMTPKYVYLVPSNMPFSTELIQSGFFFAIVFHCDGLESLRHNIYPVNSDFLIRMLPALTRCRYPEKKLLIIQNIVFHYLAEIASKEFVSPYQNLDPRIIQAVQIIETELHKNCLMKDICQRLNMSQSLFQRLFRREVQKSPKQFLNDLRHQRAAHYLRHTNKSMDEIALELGFSNRFQFSNFFRKNNSYPPCFYRKMFKGKKFTFPYKNELEKIQMAKSMVPVSPVALPELPELDWKQTSQRDSYTVEVIDCNCQSITDWPSEQSSKMEWQLYCALSAKTWIRYREKPHRMTSSKVFLIPSNMTYESGMITPGLFFSIRFRVCNALESLRRNIYSMKSDYLRSQLSALIRCRNQGKKQLMIQRIVFYYLAGVPQASFLSSFQDLDPRIMRSVEMIESGLSEKNLLKEVCGKLRMPRNFFRSLFLREVKKTPKEFVSELRFEQASYLLKNTDKGLDEIASVLGFSDRYQFSKFFRKRTQIPPIAFRKSHRASS